MPWHKLKYSWVVLETDLFLVTSQKWLLPETFILSLWIIWQRLSVSWSLPRDLNRRQYRKRCLAAQQWDRLWCRPMHPERATWVCIVAASWESAIFVQHACRIYLSCTTWPLKADSALFFRDASDFITTARDIEWDKVCRKCLFLFSTRSCANVLCGI